MVDADEYFFAVEAAIAVPCLGRIPFLPEASAAELGAMLTLPG
jgi:hypothetical protein